MIGIILITYLIIGYILASLLARSSYKCGQKWEDFNFEYYMVLFFWLFSIVPVFLIMGLIKIAGFSFSILTKVLLYPVRYSISKSTKDLSNE